MRDILIYDENEEVINYLTQWDLDVDVYIKASDVDDRMDYVHFFNPNSDRALVVEATRSGSYYVAKIPNVLLEKSVPIFGYTVVTDNDKERAYNKFVITVRKKPQPSNRVYSDYNTNDYIDAVEILVDAQMYAQNAEYYADKAEQIAATNGYMFFYIDETGSLIYKHTSNVDAQFSLVNGDLILTLE